MNNGHLKMCARYQSFFKTFVKKETEKLGFLIFLLFEVEFSKVNDV